MSATTDIDTWLATMPREKVEAAIKERQAEIKRLEDVLELHDNLRLAPTTEGSLQNGGGEGKPLWQGRPTPVEKGRPGRGGETAKIKKGAGGPGVVEPGRRGRQVVPH